MKHTPGITAGLGGGLVLTALGSQVMDGLFLGLAIFTLIGAGMALLRTLPRIRLGASERGRHALATASALIRTGRGWYGSRV